MISSMRFVRLTTVPGFRRVENQCGVSRPNASRREVASAAVHFERLGSSRPPVFCFPDPGRMEPVCKEFHRMIDERNARVRAHANNIRRYERLLATRLSDVERQFIERRLAEERSALAIL